MNTWNLRNFIPIQKLLQTLSKVTFRFISQHFLWNQYAIPLQALELHRISWLTPFSKAFIKKIVFENSVANSLALQKWCAVQFLTVFDKFWFQHLLIYRCYRIRWDYLKITQLLRSKISHLLNILYWNLYVLCYFRQKDWRISKSHQTIVYLKNGYWLMKSLFKH